MMKRRPIVTLLTDFGYADSFAAEMKGVLLSGCPDAELVDISHAIEPFAVEQAAFCLGHAYRAFPKGTIHLAVVDPGVGGVRRPLILCADGHLFVGPDNGLFSLPAAADPAFRAFAIDYDSRRASPTFHGRDLFAPSAARLACGQAPARLGRRLERIVRLPDLAPRPLPNGEGWSGRIIRSDRFGNMLTNLPAALLTGLAQPEVRLGAHRIRRWARTYGEAPAGKPAALVNSQGLIEIFVPEASAQAFFRLERPQVRLSAGIIHQKKRK